MMGWVVRLFRKRRVPAEPATAVQAVRQQRQVDEWESVQREVRRVETLIAASDRRPPR